MESWNLELETGAIKQSILLSLSLVNCENNLYRIVSMITVWTRAKGDFSDERSDMEVDWSQRPKLTHTDTHTVLLLYYTDTDTDTDQTLLCSTLHQPCPQRFASVSHESSPATSGAPCKDSTPWVRARWWWPGVACQYCVIKNQDLSSLIQTRRFATM